VQPSTQPRSTVSLPTGPAHERDIELQMDTEVRISLELLSIELWIQVFEQLSKHDLGTLTLASKHLRTICLPILFREVDLSCHQIMPLAQSPDPFPYKHAWNELIRKQNAFMRLISSSSQYGALVRKFSWTIGLFRKTGYGERDIWADGRYEAEFCAMLVNLVNVRKVRIHANADVQGELPMRPLRGLPNLFPKAVDIKLQGGVGPLLARAILHGQGAKLTSLCLDNIWGLFWFMRTREWLVSAGFATRCDGLQYLRLCEKCWERHIAERTYRDWCALLSSITTKTLVLKYGIHPEVVKAPETFHSLEEHEEACARGHPLLRISYDPKPWPPQLYSDASDSIPKDGHRLRQCLRTEFVEPVLRERSEAIGDVFWEETGGV
jgi:hypothetical protein